ncbi:hypothetical protein AACH06_03980 [Ideonella sp. DXS29W]|uniref:SepL/TyeA/HrpJ family type III secretion system gatekeeper n=1 Tax=Ideonella lacteola TaxID=2984193 RepID=A0ABU9BM74_9BURK
MSNSPVSLQTPTALQPPAVSASVASASATQAAHQPKLKELSETEWMSRVGDQHADIFGSLKRGTERAAQGRVVQLTAQRRGQEQSVNRARRLWGPAGAAQLQQAMGQGLQVLQAQGATGLRTWLERHDPLEQQLLIQALQQHLGQESTTGQALGQWDRELSQTQQASLQGLENTAEVFSELHRAGTSAAASLRGLYVGLGQGGKESPLGPVALMRGLIEKFGVENIDAAMKCLRRGALSDLSSLKPSPLGPRVLQALSAGAAFTTVRTTVASARQLLDTQWAGRPLAPSPHEARVAMCLLQAADSGATQPGQLFASDQATAMGMAPFLTQAGGVRALRLTLSNLPTSLWRHEQRGARATLLAELDQRIADAEGGDHDAAARVAARLRHGQQPGGQTTASSSDDSEPVQRQAS